MNFTRHTLKKLETLFQDLGYRVIYEKGTFQSGYCILEDKCVVVINKFFDIESRINSLLDILSHIRVDRSLLSEESVKLLAKIFDYVEPTGE